VTDNKFESKTKTISPEFVSTRHKSSQVVTLYRERREREREIQIRKERKERKESNICLLVFFIDKGEREEERGESEIQSTSIISPFTSGESRGFRVGGGGWLRGGDGLDPWGGSAVPVDCERACGDRSLAASNNNQ